MINQINKIRINCSPRDIEIFPFYVMLYSTDIFFNFICTHTSTDAVNHQFSFEDQYSSMLVKYEHLVYKLFLQQKQT